MGIQSNETIELHRASKRTVTSDLSSELATSETLTGSATILQLEGPGTLTIGTPAINTGGAVTITRGSTSRTVATGKAIQFTVDPRKAAPGLYKLQVSAESSVTGEVVARTELLRVATVKS